MPGAVYVLLGENPTKCATGERRLRVGFEECEDDQRSGFYGECLPLTLDDTGVMSSPENVIILRLFHLDEAVGKFFAFGWRCSQQSVGGKRDYVGIICVFG